MANTTIPSELIQASVALGGSPTTTTQSASDNTTKIATTAYVTAAVNALIDSAPGTMNTLNEIAAALNDDAAFNTTVTNAIATKLPLAGGTMTGNIAHGGNLTLDVVGNIHLDSGSGEIRFYDGGTYFGKIRETSGNLEILSGQIDKDILFIGNDNGTPFTALTLDMSAAGAATFNSSVTANSFLQTNSANYQHKFFLANGTTGVGYIYSTGSTFQMDTQVAQPMELLVNGATRLTLGTTGSATFNPAAGGHAVFNENGVDADFRVESDGNTHMLFVDGGNNRVGIGVTPAYALDVNSTVQIRAGESLRLQNVAGSAAATIQCDGAGSNSDLTFKTATTERLRIDSSGNVGIGTTTVDTSLHIAKHQGNANSSIKLENAAGADNSSFSIDWQLANSGAAAQIKAVRTNSPGAGATDLVFATSTNGATLVEAMTIDSSGRLLLNTTTVSAEAALNIGKVAAAGNQEGGHLVLQSSVNGSKAMHIDNYNNASTDFCRFMRGSDTGSEAVLGAWDITNTRFGIGTATPAQTLHVAGSVFAAGYYITNLQGNSQLTSASTSSGSLACYIGQGLISVSVSDAKAKENFSGVEENECLNKIVSLAGHVKKFDWIDEDWKKEKGRTVGMVAQEIYEDHSEFVHKPENYDDDGWAIRYQEIVPTLTKAIQEQQTLIESLTARIETLEG